MGFQLVRWSRQIALVVLIVTFVQLFPSLTVYSTGNLSAVLGPFGPGISSTSPTPSVVSFTAIQAEAAQIDQGSAQSDKGDDLSSSNDVPAPLREFPITTVWLNERELRVSLADNPERRRQGLQRVKDLRSLDGMVFWYPGEVRHGYWMKDTEMTLQIGFFDRTGRMIERVVMQPCGKPPCPTHVPEEEFKYVLELPADSEIKLEELPLGETRLRLELSKPGPIEKLLSSLNLLA